VNELKLTYDPSLLDEIIKRCHFDKEQIPYNEFVSFLQTGSFPINSTGKKSEMSCAFYTDVWKSLDFHMIQTLHKDNPCQYLVPFKPPQKDTSEKKRGHRAMWKKQETVIHERIVKYITVEPDGTVHELVETDKNQSEVLHMECKDTGEFLHREHTEYEQTEKFDAEFVTADRGTEEYLHLKNLEDEYEFMNSDMPKKKQSSEGEGDDGNGDEMGGEYYEEES